MKATVMYGAHDVRVEAVPDARIVEPTDALVRVIRACICGSDLWPYTLKCADAAQQSMCHEAIGIVEAVGAAVRTLKPGDLVVMPFAFSDGTCTFCHEGRIKALYLIGENPAQTEPNARHVEEGLEDRKSVV